MDPKQFGRRGGEYLSMGAKLGTAGAGSRTLLGPGKSKTATSRLPYIISGFGSSI